MSQDESRTAGGPGEPGDAGEEAGVGESGTPGHPVGDGDAVDDGGVDADVDPGDAFGKAAAQVVEDVYELRLTALLRQLVRSRGHKGAGRVLGLDPRTVAASVQQGMSRRVRDAVERMLVERDGGARDELEEAVGGLAGQVGGLKTQVAGLEGELREGMQALGETHAQGMRRLEQRLAQGVAGGGGSGTGLPRPAPVAVAGAATRRRHPGLVTSDPAEDDDDVFGNAWPLVQEWRELWDGHPAQGRGLAWVSRRERILEVEVAMLEEHGLTLPPETEPLRGLDRGAQLNWRLKALHQFGKRRARLELLARLARGLTLAGLRRVTLDLLRLSPLRWRR